MLADAGIESKWRYYPLHVQPGFDHYPKTAMTNTDQVWKDHLLLPVGPLMTSEQIEYMTDSLKMIIESLGRSTGCN